MNRHALYHRMESDWAHVRDRESFFVRLRVACGDAAKVLLHYQDEYLNHHGRSEPRVLELARAVDDGAFEYWEAIIPADGAITFYYFFEIQPHEATGEVHGGGSDLSSQHVSVFFGRGVIAESPIENGTLMFVMPALVPANAFDVPAWAKSAVVYQIFPERFANGNPENRAKEALNILPWNSEVDWRGFLGGDLAGIAQHLDYLQGLGINCLYLTPIFLSDSTHKYNIFDYYAVDPAFGTLDDLRALVADCHRRGMRVVLDAVFNHCGSEFFAFQDVREKGRRSQYWNWFDIQKWPFDIGDFPEYATWGHYGHMPKLMTGNPEVAEYFANVGAWWVRKTDIDGWRLDVAAEVDHPFWRLFRQKVKAAKPDALIVGELWHDPSPWLQGDQFDTTMNYPFWDALGSLFVGRIEGPGIARGDSIDVPEFARRMAAITVSARRPAIDALWNLVGSHDVARIATSLAGGTDRADPVVRAKLKLAVLLQFTHPGVPLVYYGDELAMEGDQNHCRLGMRWDRVGQESDLLDWYRRLSRLRRTQPVLAGGDWRVIEASAETGLYSFVRTPAQWWNMGPETGSLLIVANFSDRPHTWKLPAALASAPVWRDFIARGGLLAGLRTRSDLEGKGLQLAPWTGTVLKPCTPD